MVHLGIPYQMFDGNPPFYQDGWDIRDFYRVFEEYQNDKHIGDGMKIRKPTQNELRFCKISDSYA